MKPFVNLNFLLQDQPTVVYCCVHTVFFVMRDYYHYHNILGAFTFTST